MQWAGRRRKGNSSGPEPPPKPAANYSSTCRSCRGILVYAPLLKAGVSGRTVSAPEGSPPATATSTSWTSPQPVCLGLSSAALEELSPQSIYAARQLPEDQKVSFLLVVGHAIFTPGGGAAGAGGPPQQQQVRGRDKAKQQEHVHAHVLWCCVCMCSRAPEAALAAMTPHGPPAPESGTLLLWGGCAGLGAAQEVSRVHACCL